MKSTAPDTCGDRARDCVSSCPGSGRAAGDRDFNDARPRAQGCSSDRRGLEEARTLTTVVFDNTGTLTRDEFSVVDVATPDSRPAEEALRLASRRRRARARLESEAGEQHQATPKRANAHAISDLTLQNDHSVCVRKPRCSSRFRA
jgi:hypothetical protein